jgi:hypothetical protein
MRFNVNNYVRVKLTDEGKRAHRIWHDNLYSNVSQEKRDAWYAPPKEDADGWSKWQLWTLMQEVGWACSNGMNTPFETEIEILEG